MSAPGGALILCWYLLLRGRVGGLAEAKRPVFLRYLDEIDPGIFASHTERLEIVRNAAEKLALLREGASRAQGNLHDHDVVGARDAEVAGVIDQVARLVLREKLEAIELRHVDRLDERAMDRIAH